MKILVSWSSGKDSAWTLHRLRQTGQAGAIAGLVTTVNDAAGRVAMHAVRETLLAAQAGAAGLPLHVVRLAWPCSNGVYAERMGAFVRDAAAKGITHIAFGDLFLEDVRRYREDSLRGSGIAPLFPLWGEPTRALAEIMIDSGLRATLTCVDPRAIDRGFAGRPFDRALLEDLPPSADPCGENGEFHTFVTAGPMFDRAIDVSPGVIVERDGFVFADVLPAAEPRGANYRTPTSSVRNRSTAAGLSSRVGTRDGRGPTMIAPSSPTASNASSSVTSSPR